MSPRAYRWLGYIAWQFSTLLFWRRRHAGSTHPKFSGSWKENVSSFLRLGATSYGGPAIMGIMPAELQQKRQWVSKERFVEGLSVLNMLPEATATQLGIFLGYARGGWWGGLVGGLCFMIPAFFVMLMLTLAYASLGTSPLLRGALYGLGPVVLAIFAVAVYRLGHTAASTIPQAIIAVLAAVVSITTPLGIAGILALAGGAGLLLFHSRRPAVIVAVSVICALAAISAGGWLTPVPLAGVSGAIPRADSLLDIGTYFFKVGAFTVGDGLTMIGLHPGPGRGAGAAVAAGAAFLPSFILMLAILPVLDRVRTLAWTRAVIKGMGPAVIGLLAVSLPRLAPYALPDPFAVTLFVVTLAALALTRLGPFRAMLAGALLGLLRSRLSSLPGLKAAGHLIISMRV